MGRLRGAPRGSIVLVVRAMSHAAMGDDDGVVWWLFVKEYPFLERAYTRERLSHVP